MLTVIGGTYSEVCLHPRWNRVFGSGLRAAVAVTELMRSIHEEETVRLVSWASSKEQRRVKSLLASTGVAATFYQREKPIEWQYDHSLGPPRLFPLQKDFGSIAQEDVTLDEEHALVFGMVECRPKVRARVMVYDPQASGLAVPFSRTEHSADRLAIVANMSEAIAMAEALNLRFSKGGDIAVSLGRALLSREHAEVVVIKSGVRGATVVVDDGFKHIKSYQTDHVFPIGSGDVFSGVFAAHWIEMGADPFESARWASVATASYCSTLKFVIPNILLQEEERLLKLYPALPPNSKVRSKPVYLAGPLVTLPEVWFLEETRRCLEEQGLEVFSPKDEVGLLADIKDPTKVASEDLKGLEKCGVVFAIVDNFDPGTLFEIGYAIAGKQKKPVIAFVQHAHESDLTMLRGTGCEIHSDFATAIYRTAWRAREK